MNVPRIAFILCSLCTAGAALTAAYYWFRSSLPTPVESSDITASISDNEALYILDARVNGRGRWVAHADSMDRI